MSIEITYRPSIYKPELVTGVYVRCIGRKGDYKFKVFETATCFQKGPFYGRLGMGCTLQEYISTGVEIPEEIKQKAIETKQTVKWR